MTFKFNPFTKKLDIVSSGGGGGGVETVTGLNTNNDDPANPVVNISVDGSTIVGAGTPDSPLISILASYGIGDGIPGKDSSENSILYSNWTGGPTGLLAASPTFVWDEGSQRLGVGVTSPAYTLDVFGDINFSGQLWINGSTPYNTDWVAQGTGNLYYTDALARLALSNSTGISYNNTSGVFGLDIPNFIGGSAGQVQFNEAGSSFNGSGEFTWDNDSHLLTVTNFQVNGTATFESIVTTNGTSYSFGGTVPDPAIEMLGGHILHIKNIDAISAILQTQSLSADRTFTFPDTDGTFAMESAASDSFTTADLKTVTVVNGIITSIV